MNSKKAINVTQKRRLPNITDNGFVDVKEAPIIYAYIYDVEALDAQKFNKNYNNADMSKNAVEISGFELENNELVPKHKK